MKYFQPSPIKDLKHLANQLQEKVNELFEACNWSPDPVSALDQVGLLNGKEIIEDYLDNGEAGVAFDHLNYMIEETEIQLNEADQHAFERIRALYK